MSFSTQKVAFFAALAAAFLLDGCSCADVPAPAAYSNTCDISKGKQYTLPELPYRYNDLEPVISAEIMQLHHSKHHAAYVKNLNEAEEKTRVALSKGDLNSVLLLQTALNFNYGGHVNHAIFWTNLAPIANGGGNVPTEGPLLDQIRKDFGSVDKMQERLSALAVSLQGSGWAWLGYSLQDRRLRVTTCANQDLLEKTAGLIPLFGIDVWEHAYYLQYKNVRPDYVKAIWQVANWSNIAERFQNALLKKQQK